VLGSLGDLIWAGTVDLDHTFNFLKFNIVSFLVDMSFVFMSCDHSFSTFLDHHNNEVFCLLTISISNHVLVSVVNESVTPRTEGLRRDVSASVSSASSVDHFLAQNFSINDHLSLADNMQSFGSNEAHQSSFIRDNLNFDIRVELLQFCNASVSS